MNCVGAALPLAGTSSSTSSRGPIIDPARIIVVDQTALATDEGESHAQLHEELLKVSEQ